MEPINVYIGEFIGTTILLLLGNSVNASVLLKKTVSSTFTPNWCVIVFGWCFAVTFGLYAGIFLGAPGHLNPAVTIALATGNIFPWVLVPGTIIAQCLGAFVGATLTVLHYYPHFKVTKSDEGNCVGIFATGPAINHKGFNLMSEVLATAVFLLCVLVLGPMPKGATPFVLGILVASIGFSFGGTTGYALNPARDFPTRLAYAILPIPNKGDANWQYAWIPVVGPIVGAVLAMQLFLALMKYIHG